MIKSIFLKVPCPLCGSLEFTLFFEGKDYEYKLPGIFFVSVCNKCGLIFQNPRPKFKEILKYYNKNYEPFKKVGSVLMQQLREHFLVEPRINKYADLYKNSTHKIKALDVGCANGDLILELKKLPRFIPEGVEPVRYAADMAKKRGLKVHCCTLENLKAEKNYYDLIIMNHVIEHLPNVNEVIDKVYSLLKKGGYFCGELPCSDSLERAFFKKYWSMYHLPRHLTFFNKKLFKRFLSEKGFINININLQPMPSSWQGSIRNFTNDKNLPEIISKMFSGHSLLLNLISFPYAYLSAKLGYSSIMHFTARK